MKLTKNQKLGLLSIPVLVGAYLIYRQFAKPKPKNIQQKKNAISEVKVTPKTIPNPTPSCSYPLKKGLYNCELVKQLQKALNSYPDAVVSRSGSNKVLGALVEDGDFGAKTEEYLIAVTSTLAIDKGSDVITYTLTTIPNESDFNKLVDEIDKAITDAIPNYPGVSVPATPCNPLYEICY
jgi:hypothetical protein